MVILQPPGSGLVSNRVYFSADAEVPVDNVPPNLPADATNTINPQIIHSTGDDMSPIYGWPFVEKAEIAKS